MKCFLEGEIKVEMVHKRSDSMNSWRSCSVLDAGLLH